MDEEDEILVTSRSRTPSLIDVTSQNERIFAQLPDIIQEAAVSIEFSSQSPSLLIQRVQNPQLLHTPADLMTTPMFIITPDRDSAIEMPDLTLTDSAYLSKYGSDLTANFTDIRAFGSRAFFQKENLSNGLTYSLCACATGYIWVSVTPLWIPDSKEEFSDLEVQIGTLALKTKAITAREIPCRCKWAFDADIKKSCAQIALLLATVMAKYLRLRIIGLQYEDAAEMAIGQSRKELASLGVVHPGMFEDFMGLLRGVCVNAPMPPTSDVSLISRKMITRRWECWREKEVLRRRFGLMSRVARCMKGSGSDSIDLLSGCFKKVTVDGKEPVGLPR